jgi:hypothetical protein
MGCGTAEKHVVSTAIRNDFSSVMSKATYSEMDVQQKAESLFTVAENAATGSCKAT